MEAYAHWSSSEGGAGFNPTKLSVSHNLSMLFNNGENMVVVLVTTLISYGLALLRLVLYDVIYILYFCNVINIIQPCTLEISSLSCALQLYLVGSIYSLFFSNERSVIVAHLWYHKKWESGDFWVWGLPAFFPRWVILWKVTCLDGILLLCKGATKVLVLISF